VAISVISVHEIRQGIELAPAGAKRNALEVWLQILFCCSSPIASFP